MIFLGKESTYMRKSVGCKFVNYDEKYIISHVYDFRPLKMANLLFYSKHTFMTWLSQNIDVMNSLKINKIYGIQSQIKIHDLGYVEHDKEDMRLFRDWLPETPGKSLRYLQFLTKKSV